MSEKEKIIKEISFLNNLIKKLESEKEKYASSPVLLKSNEYKILYLRIAILEIRIKILTEGLVVYDVEPCCFGNLIDVYEDKVTDEYIRYIITLHGEKEVIGKFSYTSELNGNVAYEIYQEYQGNGYGSEALLLVVDRLTEIGINNISLNIYKDNFKSHKLANKLKELYSCEITDHKDILGYHFDISKKIKDWMI